MSNISLFCMCICVFGAQVTFCYETTLDISDLLYKFAKLSPRLEKNKHVPEKLTDVFNITFTPRSIEELVEDDEQVCPKRSTVRR